MTVASRLSSIRDCSKGMAAVEFALVLLPLLLFIMGTIELGFRIYMISVTNGAIREAARMASTGTYTATQIDTKVTSSIKALRSDTAVGIVKKSYSDFTGVGLPEPITTGSVASGTYCYDDVNGSTFWENDQGASDLGGAEDVLYYEVTASYPTLFKLSENLLKFAPTTTIKLNTLVSNEPFAAVVNLAPVNRCVTAA